ncbi:hypothetical protein SAMN04487951_10540 [Vreelandella arcis]|uniref:Uncharacterized protein n=1 Tax=Vreelandella arcis TaxID=416873 RepID=A0A1H0BCJ8_9GAMM|nr:hypothetical protein SAMN04487951_10540 [Halomonas arcis]
MKSICFQLHNQAMHQVPSFRFAEVFKLMTMHSLPYSGELIRESYLEPFSISPLSLLQPRPLVSRADA